MIGHQQVLFEDLKRCYVHASKWDYAQLQNMIVRAMPCHIGRNAWGQLVLAQVPQWC